MPHPFLTLSDVLSRV